MSSIVPISALPHFHGSSTGLGAIDGAGGGNCAAGRSGGDVGLSVSFAGY